MVFQPKIWSRYIYNHILGHARKTNYQAAKICLKINFSQEISTIDILRTNIVAEKTVELMKEII